MGKGKAVVLAVFTAWPFLYILLFICMAFSMIISGFAGGGHPAEPPFIIWIILPLHFFTMFEMLALIVIYIIHLFKTDRVPQDKKALWAVVLFLGNMIAIPVYWYFYIWRERKPQEPGPPHGDNP
jgi:hypothetical protein